MILDFKLAISDGTGDMKPFALIDANDLFTFMSSSVTKHPGWVVRANSTPVVVKITNIALVHSSGVTN